LLRFTAIGGTATALHAIVGLSLVGAGLHALFANLLAFLSAFAASFAGHFYFTFSELNPGFAEALGRFVITALGAFLLNETLLALLLLTNADPGLALLISTGIAAGATFFLGRFWAFSPGSR
jgi:putative flippase GtrA